VFLVLGLVATPASASAASPKPSSLPRAVEAWLDAPYEVPADLPPGGTVEVGLTFWDTQARALREVDGVYAVLLPAKGHADPTSADGVPDWPGHVRFDVPAPRGGPGRLEFGLHTQDCRGQGPCTDIDLPLHLAGTGPPPDAPRAALVEAEPLPLVGDIVAGRPVSLAALITPKGAWAFDALELPDRIVAVATDGLGADLGSGELLLSGAPGSPYTGKLTIAKAGGATIGYAIPGENGEPDQFMEGAARVHVIEAGRRLDSSTAAPLPGESGAPAAPTPEGDGGSPVVGILLAGLLVLAAILVFGGTVRGWLRRGGD
jgi:hypothetical protein